MKTNIKNIEFRPHHVGIKVSCAAYGEGVITKFSSKSDAYPVYVEFKIGRHGTYTKYGKPYITAIYRTLFIGHNVEILAKEDELPDPIPKCPFCSSQHEIYFSEEGSKKYEFTGFTEKHCPLKTVQFECESQAKSAYKDICDKFNSIKKGTE